MLEIRNLSAFYGNSRALRDVSLSVPKEGFMAVLGRNGVGKTTLIRAIMGMMDRCEGEIVLDGTPIGQAETHKRANLGVSYVPQGRGILPSFTVRENLLMGTLARSGGKLGRINETVFELFPILKDFLDRRGGNLSGGQQQQLAIARAMLANPKVILLDEPTEGVQPNVVAQIEEAIITLNREFKITIVIVEQDVNFARRASSSFALLEKGAVAASGGIDGLSEELVHKHMSI